LQREVLAKIAEEHAEADGKTWLFHKRLHQGHCVGCHAARLPLCRGP